MGLFSKQSADEKARTFAEKKGVDVSGAVAVGKALHGDHQVVAAVHPERVDLHDLGKMGSMTRAGASVTSLPRDRVGSVSTHREGLTGVLTIQGVGVPVEWRGDLDTVERLATALRQ